MSFKIYGLDNKEKWDEIVKSFKDYEPFYLSDYVLAFKNVGEGEPLLFYLEDGDNRAISVMFKRDVALSDQFKGLIPLDTYFDLISPYGYGGFLISGVLTKTILNDYRSACEKGNIICEFVRFLLNSEYITKYIGESKPITHNIIRSLDMDIDTMFMDFEHKVRKNIKKAIRNGLETFIEENLDHIDEFLKIYYGTMSRDAADNRFYFPKSFFETLGKMQGNYMFVYVKKDEKIIAAELIIFGAVRAYSYLGGTNSEYFDFRPNELLKFAAIKWLKDKGIKEFVLGGGYGSDDGIFNYKKSFAPNGIVDFYIGKCIFNKEDYEKLVQLRVNHDGSFDKENKFFPLYRS